MGNLAHAQLAGIQLYWSTGGGTRGRSRQNINQKNTR